MHKIYECSKAYKKLCATLFIVDGVPFTLPVQAKNTPALMAGFFCDYNKAADLLPGNELHPFKFINGKAVFMITVVNYVDTTIGKYIEYSLALACTKVKSLHRLCFLLCL